MTSMLVVGSVGLDTIHNAQGTFPRVVGGSAIYAAMSGSFFAPVQLVGVVGKDFPDDVVRELRARGIDTTGLEVADGKTFHWEGRYADDLTSRVSLRTELNVFADFHPKIPDSFRETPFVMLGNIDPELQMEVLDQVREPRLVIADTMNFWIDGKLDSLVRMLARVDVLVINEEEARQLSGQWPIKAVARALQKLGPEIVIIKQGEYGAFLFVRDDIFSAPAFPLDEALDPTGAGDSFAGGFLGYVAARNDTSPATLRSAVVYGSAVASFCVEGVSIDCLAAVNEEEVRDRVMAFHRLVHFGI